MASLPMGDLPMANAAFRRVRARVLVAAGAALLASGCGSHANHASAQASMPDAAAAPAGFEPARPLVAGASAAVLVYYLRTVHGVRYLVPERHLVPAAPAIAQGAAEELLAGAPIYPGSRRPFPDGTRLLGLRVRGAAAVVDLSREALGSGGDAPVQALVYTLTGVGGVRRVMIEIEGRTSGLVGGHDLANAWGGHYAPGESLAPDPDARLAPIALTEPRPGAALAGDRVVVQGAASVFAGMVGLRLRDQAGMVVAQSMCSAAVGAPRRGVFSGALVFAPPASPQRWTLEAFAASPADGSVAYSVQIVVAVGPVPGSPAPVSLGSPSGATSIPAASTSTADDGTGGDGATARTVPPPPTTALTTGITPGR